MTAHPLIVTLRERRRELGLSKTHIQMAAGMARDTFDRRETSGRCSAIEQLERWALALGYRLTLTKIGQEPVYWS